MKFEYKDNGHSIEFELGKIYYIADWYVPNRKNILPIIIKLLCIEDNEDFMNEGFNLKEIKNIIPSDYKPNGYQHPGNILSKEWKHYFHSSLESAYKMFYDDYNKDRDGFFNKIFGVLQ